MRQEGRGGLGYARGFTSAEQEQLKALIGKSIARRQGLAINEP